MNEKLKHGFYLTGVAASSLIGAYAVSNEVLQRFEFDHPENQYRIELVTEQNKNIENVLDITKEYASKLDSLDLRSVHHKNELKYLTDNPLFSMHGKTADELKEIHELSLERILSEKQKLNDEIEGNAFVKEIYEAKIEEIKGSGYISKEQRKTDRFANFGVGLVGVLLFGYSLAQKNKKD